jgi:hypothetical protein
MKEWSYTSTSRMGRTACTEPQCLYKGALYLYLLYNVIYFVPYEFHLFLAELYDLLATLGHAAGGAVG